MTKYNQQILLTTDAGFIKRLPAFIKNLIAFNREHLDIHIIASLDVPNSEYASLFSEFTQVENCTLHFHYISPEQRFAYEKVDYSKDDRANAMSLRLYATLLNLTGRVLYLDVDIICTAPYAELFDSEKVDLQGKTLGVVADPYLMYKNVVSEGKAFRTKLSGKAKDLPFDADNPYFNSGFLLIDMDKLNQSNLWLEHIAELKDYTAFPDQDLLNVLHFGDTVELSSKYNYLAYHLINTRYYFYKDKWDKVTQVNKHKVRHKTKEAVSLPADYQFKDFDVFKKVVPTFLHFAGRQKQWNNTATEFVDAYNLFNQSLAEIVSKSVSYYQDYFATLFKVYGYLPVLNDFYDPETFGDLSREKCSFYFHQCKPWTYNPLLLNTKMFASKGFKVFLRNALTTKGREKFNLSQYQKDKVVFTNELKKLG
ncbi:hypothetical protein CKF54_01210 [Psittacicella hinzii]|uniref:Glycosyl transferase family 8 n=1 Tax=Psittacicella hinzii TaxID=2028575 RepID=A0A3A1YDM6_9GAMM|nr:glycosyltransferase [Psittacicella hinzii]RIY34237.1 hypothetical protein CKF54_01210 [Psittacicella hinzii]